jgi:hypothetical protein
VDVWLGGSWNNCCDSVATWTGKAYRLRLNTLKVKEKESCLTGCRKPLKSLKTAMEMRRWGGHRAFGSGSRSWGARVSPHFVTSGVGFGSCEVAPIGA